MGTVGCGISPRERREVVEITARDIMFRLQLVRRCLRICACGIVRSFVFDDNKQSTKYTAD